MNPVRRRALISILALTATACSPYAVGAYDVETHRRLAAKAATISPALSGVLVGDLQLSTGSGSRFRASLGVGRGSLTLDAVDWIGEGAALEDEPETRVFNHFHDPFRPWSSAGLRFILPLGESSIRWAEMFDQSVGGTWSWPVARAYFLEALTGATPEARETAFARTFRAIGHLTHLVQDATVPAHVRNDPHLSPRVPLVGRVPIDADWYEGWIETKLVGTGILDAPIRSPLPSVFALPTDPEAALPIAGLIDTDRLTADAGPRGLSDPADVGLAELVNPNFLSRDTIFRRNARPAVFDLGPGFFEPVGRGVRQYFPKRAAGTDTMELSHLVAEGPLYTPLRRVVATPPSVAWTIDDARVHEAYARELVPRAIGYSAALIDYFFRGRLDVDLFDDGDSGDPSILRVEGTNASNEALVDGTLTLYAEDVDGQRRALTPVGGDTLVSDIPAGAPLTSTDFLVDAPAERFVAVYQGTLGEERATGGSPGAVIGKVLGGVRVEQIFPEDGQWNIRTPKGVFRTALTTSEFEQVRWGDGDNVVVARTRLGTNQPNRFVSYALSRQPGSPEVGPPGATMVQLTQLDEAVFPYGMSAGTTVQFNASIRYRQRLVRVEVHEHYVENTVQELVRVDVTSPAIETVKAETFSFADQFGILLDTAHSSRFSEPDDRRYAWDIMDFTADTSGALRALVRVTLVRPLAPGARTKLITLNRETGALQDDVHDVLLITPSFPSEANPLLWAVVDLKRASVIASTAEEVVAITIEQVDEARPFATPWAVFTPVTIPGVWTRWTQTTGLGTFVHGWYPWGVTPVNRTQPGVIITETISSDVGVRSVTVSGLRSGALRSALPSTWAVASTPATQDYRYYSYPDTTTSGPDDRVLALAVLTNTGRIVTSPPQLSNAQRVPNGSAGERLVFVAQGRSQAPSYVVVWDPQDQKARIAAQLPSGSHVLRAATGAAAVVRSFIGSPPALESTIVPFGPGRSPVTVPDEDVASEYALLEPSYLYGLADLRFHTVTPALRKTALPAPLMGSGPTTGSFHTIRLP